MTPVGIVLGTVASGLLESTTAVLIEASFNALAAGTFIYVAILDVINTEMSSIDDRVAHFVRSVMIGEDDVPMPVADEDRGLKFFLVLIGFIGMAVIALWA
jgi:zinc transporter ZupT